MKTKKSAKSKKNVPAKGKEKTYLASLDLREWYEDFVHSINKNGTQKYPTIWRFIKTKAKHGWQRDFLYWLLGPEATEGKSEYSDFPQYDWIAKRQRGFWYSSENIEELSKHIKSKATAFDRLQSAGESLLADLAECNELQLQISKEFGGKLFLENNSAEENSSRVSLLLELKTRVHDMKAKILQTFAKTQGMDMNQLSQFLEVFASGIGNAASAQLGYGGGRMLEAGSKDESTYRRVLNGLSEMVINKSAELDLKLPDSEAERLVEEVTRPIAKKKAVN